MAKKSIEIAVPYRSLVRYFFPHLDDNPAALEVVDGKYFSCRLRGTGISGLNRGNAERGSGLKILVDRRLKGQSDGELWKQEIDGQSAAICLSIAPTDGESTLRFTAETIDSLQSRDVPAGDVGCKFDGDSPAYTIAAILLDDTGKVGRLAWRTEVKAIGD